MEQEAIKLLREARRFLNRSGPTAVNLVYKTPAQSLREQADAIEYQDDLIRRIDEFLGTTK